VNTNAKPQIPEIREGQNKGWWGTAMQITRKDLGDVFSQGRIPAFPCTTEETRKISVRTASSGRYTYRVRPLLFQRGCH
jgi:hypothetical protein